MLRSGLFYGFLACAGFTTTAGLTAREGSSDCCRAEAAARPAPAETPQEHAEHLERARRLRELQERVLESYRTRGH